MSIRFTALLIALLMPNIASAGPDHKGMCHTHHYYHPNTNGDLVEDVSRRVTHCGPQMSATPQYKQSPIGALIRGGGVVYSKDTSYTTKKGTTVKCRLSVKITDGLHFDCQF